jgi:hypothetical protein
VVPAAAKTSASTRNTDISFFIGKLPFCFLWDDPENSIIEKTSICNKHLCFFMLFHHFLQTPSETDCRNLIAEIF